jgi:hypothetical protein
MCHISAKCPVFKASARVENGAHRIDVGVSAGGFRAAGGPKPDISGHFFRQSRKNGTKQLSLDFGAAALNAKAFAADRTVDPTAVSRRSAPAPRALRDTGRHTSGKGPASAGARSQPRASSARLPYGELLVWSTCAPYILRIAAFAARRRKRRPGYGDGCAGRWRACAPGVAIWSGVCRPTGIGHANRRVSRQSRNVLFSSQGPFAPHMPAKAAIPSSAIVLHRGQPSRLPSGAKAGGLDSARPRCVKNSL